MAVTPERRLAARDAGDAEDAGDAGDAGDGNMRLTTESIALCQAGEGPWLQDASGPKERNSSSSFPAAIGCSSARGAAMATDFDKKTVGFCAGSAVASIAGTVAVSGLSCVAMPAVLAGAVAGAGALLFRRRMLSLPLGNASVTHGTYNRDLEDELRLKTSDGFRFTEMGRHFEGANCGVELSAFQQRILQFFLASSGTPRRVP
eukprot:Skav201731  [mRNA]  locus=scaffold311:709039:717716:- [translate_table: standard]